MPRGEARPACKGYSLIEIMVASALLLTLMTVAVALLVATLNGYTRGSNRSDLQQQSMVAITHACADLESAGLMSLTLYNPLDTSNSVPTAFSLVPVDKTVVPDGTVNWQTNLVVYAFNPNAQTITRRVFSSTDPLLTGANVVFEPTIPPRIPTSLLLTLASTSNSTDQVFAHNVSLFEIHNGNDGGSYIVPPMSLQIRLSAGASYQSQNETFDLTRTFLMRNGL